MTHVTGRPTTNLPRTGISSGTLRSVIEYGLPFLGGGGSVPPPSPPKCRRWLAVQHACTPYVRRSACVVGTPVWCLVTQDWTVIPWVKPDRWRLGSTRPQFTSAGGGGGTDGQFAGQAGGGQWSIRSTTCARSAAVMPPIYAPRRRRRRRRPRLHVAILSRSDTDFDRRRRKPQDTKNAGPLVECAGNKCRERKCAEN